MTQISWVNVAFGLWLAAAAFVLPHRTGVGITEDLISGSVLALSALWAARAYRPRVSETASWTVALTGLWVAAAPFALGVTNLVVKDRRAASSGVR